MNKMLKGMLAVMMILGASVVFGQQEGDRLLGVYQAIEEGKESKVRFTRETDGTYKGQIFWLKNPTHADGTPKYDLKNPDPKKRTVRSDQVVVVYGVRYNAAEKIWEGGRVYNPTNGKDYKCEVSFENDKTIRVKGSLLGFSRSVYWHRVEE